MKIDPSLDYLDPIFRDNKLIFTNIEILEDYDVKIENYKFDDEDIQGSMQPWKIELCNVCYGIGSCLNSSMRNHAYSQEDYAEDPDFFHDMIQGKYDVTCRVCNGNGRYITITNVTDELEKILKEQQELKSEEEFERKMEY